MNKGQGILWCIEKNTKCMSAAYGKCTKDRCNLEDLEYVEKQKEIDRRYKENQRRLHEGVEVEIKTPKQEELEKLIKEIDKKKKQAIYFYSSNKPWLGEIIEIETRTLIRKKKELLLK